MNFELCFVGMEGIQLLSSAGNICLDTNANQHTELERTTRPTTQSMARALTFHGVASRTKRSTLSSNHFFQCLFMSLHASAVYCDCTYAAFPGLWSCCMTASFHLQPLHRCSVSYPIFIQSGIRPHIPSSRKLRIAYENLSCLVVINNNPSSANIYMEHEDQSRGVSVIRSLPSCLASNAIDDCLPPLPTVGAVDEVGLKPQPIRRPHKARIADFAHWRRGDVSHVRVCGWLGGGSVAAADLAEFGWRWHCRVS